MRYLPLTKENRKEMLSAIGAASVDDLYASVPKDIMSNSTYDLPDHKSEAEVESILASYANQNIPSSSVPSFLGAGCYFHHVPASVDYIIQRSEFLTAYTPYQPEIAQGTLKAIFQFQTIIANLTGQEVANASMYDGATATAEAALMSMRVKKGRNKILIAGNLNPQYEEVVKTYLRNFDVEVKHSDAPDENTACVIQQSPDFYGSPQSLDSLRSKCDESGAMLVGVVSEIVSLGLLPPLELADIVVGEAQSIGVAMSYGGPHLGFFACKKQYVRQMPGRLCGITEDADGKKSYVLTLNTREQHIRREKATSNICTNQGLMSLAFTVHMSLLGEIGFKKLAKINHNKACKLADRLEKINGVNIETPEFFNEFTVSLSKDSLEVVNQLAEQDIIAGLAVDGNKLIVCATETTSDEDIEKFANALEAALK